MSIEQFINKVHNGHVLDILKLIPSKSVDCVVTSPPYWGLRDYGILTKIIWGGDSNCKHKWGIPTIKKYSGGTNKALTGQHKDKHTHFKSFVSSCIKCGAWNGQLGLEPHPNMYIEHLVEIFREVKRVLKDSGSLWLNIGDTYCGGGTHHGKWKESGKHKLKKGNNYMGTEPHAASNLKMDGKWLQPKQLMLIPSRVAVSLQNDGWILRSDVIWYKPNHMPSSVKDRLSKSYEHVFFFVKNRKYYFDLDSIRVPQKEISIKRAFSKNNMDRRKGKGKEEYALSGVQQDKYYKKMRKLIKEGKLPGKNPGDMWRINTKACRIAHFAVFPDTLVKRILKCAVPKNGIVLDIFIGSGTTGMVAKQMGLNFIGIELNREYCSIADKRIGGVEIVEYPVNREKITKFIEDNNIEVHKHLREENKCNYNGHCPYKSFNKENCLRKDNRCIKEKK